jgi:hypothetical protein
MVVQYSVDVLTESIQDRRPSEILKVMCALLTEADWSSTKMRSTSIRTTSAM